MAKIVVNAVGIRSDSGCKGNEGLKGNDGDGTLEVQVDNETAVQNLCRLADSKNLKAFAEKKKRSFRGDDPGRSAAGGRKGRRGGLLHPGEKRKYGSGHCFGP